MALTEVGHAKERGRGHARHHAFRMRPAHTTGRQKMYVLKRGPNDVSGARNIAYVITGPLPTECRVLGSPEIRWEGRAGGGHTRCWLGKREATGEWRR